MRPNRATFRLLVDTSQGEHGNKEVQVANGVKTRRSPVWTISLAADITGDQQLTETLRRVPTRVVSDGHQAETDVRLISRPEPAAAADGQVPRIIVTDTIDAAVLRAAIQSGAAALIPHDVTVEAARAILTAVAAGSFPIPRHLAVALVTRLELPPAGVLSDRDRIILDHLARGDTIATIARRLGCSQRHTRRHLRTLWDKMGVPGRAQGLITATRQGLLNS